MTTEATINERGTARYTATLTDDQGAPIAVGAVNTLTLTLYESRTGTILNGRNAQNVKNANDVTIDAQGVLTWLVKAEDAICVTAYPKEVHVALFQITWGDGRAHRWEHRFTVINLNKVP